jgi:FKBP-type peptidyl-prolyl cis-trans isomerase
MSKASLAAVLALGAYGAAAMAQAPLDSDQDKTLYALGVAIGSNVKSFGLTSKELEIVEAGLGDTVLGKDSRVDMQVYGPKIQQLADARTAAAAATEKKASAAYLQQAAKERGAQVSDSGLVYIPIKEGTGASPKATDTVTVNYTGSLRDGTVFDSSIERGQAATFSLEGVIQCWSEGLQKMKIGGKSKLVCPSELAYGDSGQGPIPAGAALVFEVELLGIK